MKTACTLILCAIFATAPSLFAADAAKGKTAFAQRCAGCHAIDSPARKMGPSLQGLYKHAKMANGKKPADATVRAVIDEGGKGMPAYKTTIPEAVKDDLLAYLKTL